jgi:Na+-driven multidrug efflux pump
MNFKKVFISFGIGFAITLIVSSLVTYLYSLGFHETANVDWETSFQLAIIFGIVFPAMEARKEKDKEK